MRANKIDLDQVEQGDILIVNVCDIAGKTIGCECNDSFLKCCLVLSVDEINASIKSNIGVLKVIEPFACVTLLRGEK